MRLWAATLVVPIAKASKSDPVCLILPPLPKKRAAVPLPFPLNGACFRSCSLWALARRTCCPPAIHRQRGASDIGSFIGSQKQCCPCHLLWIAHAAKRRLIALPVIM